MLKILSTLKQGFWIEFSIDAQNVYDKYSPQSINFLITESVWYNDNISLEYIKQWFEKGVKYFKRFLGP